MKTLVPEVEEVNDDEWHAIVCSQIELSVTGWEYKTSALTKQVIDTYVLLRQIHLGALTLVDSINNSRHHRCLVGKQQYIMLICYQKAIFILRNLQPDTSWNIKPAEEVNTWIILKIDKHHTSKFKLDDLSLQSVL